MAIKDTSIGKEGKDSTVLVIFSILEIAIVVGWGKYHSIRVTFRKTSHTLSLKWQCAVEKNIEQGEFRTMVVHTRSLVEFSLIES
jgi:hypothetical protein